MTLFRYGVVVQDFGKSWVSGLAFLAVIKSIDSSLVDIRKARLRTPKQNLEDAFRIAHYSLGIPRLLEPEGKDCNSHGVAGHMSRKTWHVMSM